MLLDATNATRSIRKRYIRLARFYGVSPVAVYIPCDIATAIARDVARPHPVGDAIVRGFFDRLQPPTVEDGFDEVVEVGGPST